MTQQINLYQESLFGRREPLGAPVVLLISIFCLVVLSSWYGFVRWQVHRLQGELSRTEGALILKTEELARLQTLYPVRQKSPLLEEEIARLQVLRTARLPLIDLLSSREMGKSGGFSPFLEGLARQSLTGVWLRGVAFSGAGREVTLEGSALRPDQVPRFLQLLGNEEVFAGMEFRRCQISRPEESSERVDFLLRTVEKGEGR